MVQSPQDLLYDQFIYAAESGNLTLLQQTTQQGAGLNFCYDALLLSTREGHLPVVRYLIEHVAQLQPDEFPFILRLSIREGHSPIVEYLITHGASLKEGIEYATIYRKPDILAWLQDYQQSQQEQQTLLNDINDVTLPRNKGRL